VDELRGGDADGEVRTDDDVVGEDVARFTFDRPGANASFA